MRGAAAHRRDAPETLLTAAMAGLPECRRQWGRAMLGELADLAGGFTRWRFTLGCLRALLALPLQRPGSAAPFISMVQVAAAGCGALLVAGAWRYPFLREGAGPEALLAALVLLGVYVLVARFLVSRLSYRPAMMRMVWTGSAVLAAAWAGLGVSIAAESNLAFVALAAMPLTCVSVGILCARRAGAASSGRQAAALAALVSALWIFVVQAGDIVLLGARPDAGQLRDFAASGAPDIASYAVSDGLGTAIMVLVLMPLASGLLGAAGAAVSTRAHHRRPSSWRPSSWRPSSWRPSSWRPSS